MKRLLSLAFATATTATSALASASPPPSMSTPVDVTLPDMPPARRWVAIELNPVSLIIGKISANVIVVPVEHHALVLSPFFATTTTAPIYVYDAMGAPTQLPTQSFTGGGGELGYRYYFGRGGPRGLFLGPSFVLGDFSAKAQDGSTTSYMQLGGALDLGFQALVFDRLSLSLGAGLQYLASSTTIPPQQFPADVYANSGLRPRLLASIGVAF
jgi:hypothetical protein